MGFYGRPVGILGLTGWAAFVVEIAGRLDGRGDLVDRAPPRSRIHTVCKIGSMKVAAVQRVGMKIGDRASKIASINGTADGPAFGRVGSLLAELPFCLLDEVVGPGRMPAIARDEPDVWEEPVGALIFRLSIGEAGQPAEMQKVGAALIRGEVRGKELGDASRGLGVEVPAVSDPRLEVLRRCLNDGDHSPALQVGNRGMVDVIEQGESMRVNRSDVDVLAAGIATLQPGQPLLNVFG